MFNDHHTARSELWLMGFGLRPNNRRRCKNLCTFIRSTINYIYSGYFSIYSVLRPQPWLKQNELSKPCLCRKFGACVLLRSWK